MLGQLSRGQSKVYGYLGNISIAYKLSALGGVLIMAILILGIMGQRNLIVLNHGMNDLAVVQMTAVRNILLVSDAQNGLRALAFRSVVAGLNKNDEDMQICAEDLETFSIVLENYFGNLETLSLPPETRDALKGIKEKVLTYSTAVSEIVDLSQSGDNAKIAEGLAALELQYTALAENMEQVADRISTEAMKSAEVSANSGTNARRTNVAISLFALLVGVLLTLAIAHSILISIRKTASSALSLSEGDLSVHVVSDGTDEVSRLGSSLNHAIHNIRNTMQTIMESSDGLVNASGELRNISHQMEADTLQTSSKAATASESAEKVNESVQLVAEGARHMTEDIRSIKKNAEDASAVAQTAVDELKITHATLEMLSQSSTEINNFITVITAIAKQTNLLALNATIEAARAGEMGKGFAVVASEVKELAGATTRASDDIKKIIQGMYTNTQNASLTITKISKIVEQIYDIQTVTVAAVTRQTATTDEMGRSVAEVASANSEISGSISDVATSAQGITQGAAKTLQAADSLASMADQLKQLVHQFKV